MPPRDLALRPVIESDIPVFFAQQRNPEVHHMVGFGAKDPNDEKAFTEKWMKILANPDLDTRAILLEGMIVGHVVSFVKEEKRQVGYLIDREHWGKGVATRAMELFLKDLSERPLYAGTAWDNLASMRILEKCGFVRVGTARSYGNARGCEIEEILWMLP